jgi:hypothetical protein
MVGKRGLIALLLVVTALLPGAAQSATAAPGPSAGLAASTFDSGLDGWAVTGDGISPAWQAAGGNPGGHAQATDLVGGDTWYWVAPAKFLGDQSAAYGGTLHFELKQSLTEEPFTDLDVMLEGRELSLFYDTDYDPAQVWTSYTLILNAEVGWRTLGDQFLPATAAEIRAVLSDLVALHIRGEFQLGDDVGGLDNVILSGPDPSLVRIPGTAVIFFANRSDVSIPPLGGDLIGFPLMRNCLAAPCEGFLEETFPVRFNISPGATVTISGCGGMDYYGHTQPSVGPDGDPGSGEGRVLALEGISGIDGPEGALVGVFLSDANPNGATPPETLDFGPGSLGTGFATLQPALGQVFFIGDGLTGSGTGTRQTFSAPAGATRFFLGIADAFSFWGNPGAYDDNKGAFYAQATGVLQPAGYLPLILSRR